MLCISGKSKLAAKKFALLVDKKVIGWYTSFLTAISRLFSYFYVLNIEYPKEAAATLEFIQRWAYSNNQACYVTTYLVYL